MRDKFQEQEEPRTTQVRNSKNEKQWKATNDIIPKGSRIPTGSRIPKNNKIPKGNKIQKGSIIPKDSRIPKGSKRLEWKKVRIGRKPRRVSKIWKRKKKRMIKKI